jgi:hypothetical protein
MDKHILITLKSSKSNLCLLLLLCLSSGLFAQENKSNFSFGIKIGMNNSDITGEDLDRERTGYIGTEIYGSGFAQYEISEKISGQVELIFSWTDRVNYIEIPIYVKMDVLKKWSIKSGVKFDYIPDSNESLNIGGSAIITRSGISLPLGVEFSISENWLAEIVYNIGFTEQTNDFILDIYKAKRNTLRIGLGYRF